MLSQAKIISGLPGQLNGLPFGSQPLKIWHNLDRPGSRSPEQFYSLYERTARALKSVDPALKVGGDAKAFPYDGGPYLEGLIDYCAAHKLPLDFYSWHTYADGSADPYDAVRLAKQIRAVLDTHGFPKAESILSEWNLSADFMDDEKQTLQGAENAAYIGAVLNYLQDAPIDHAQFYRGDAAWMGLFDLKGQYFKTAYTFKAFAKMLDSRRRLLVTGADFVGFSVIAGRSEDGKSVQVFISNYAIPAGYKPHTFAMPSELQKMGPPLPDFSKVKFLPPRTDIVYRNNAGYNLTISNLPWGNDAFTIKRYRISKRENFELLEEKSEAGGSSNLGKTIGSYCPPPKKQNRFSGWPSIFV
jgi:xylan 1,4-beta-xylosidase